MDAMIRQTKKQLRVYIRWMIRRDMREVLQIEQASFEFGWTEEDFYRCLGQSKYIGMVAEHDEKVVGFIIYELHDLKIHIANLAVHPNYRRMGVGGQIVTKLISKLSKHRRVSITLELRETNSVAQLFFKQQGFLWKCTFPGYYKDSKEDAYFMEYQINGS